MKQAAAGSLSKPEVLKAEVKRMLADAKSKSLYDNFASEWLETRLLESVVPGRDTFPDFDDYLRLSMQKETELFFTNIVRNDGSILDLINSKFTFLNQRLAAHYGIPGVKGAGFQKSRSFRHSPCRCVRARRNFDGFVLCDPHFSRSPWQVGVGEYL